MIMLSLITKIKLELMAYDAMFATAQQGATTLVGPDGLDGPPGLAVPRVGPARHARGVLVLCLGRHLGPVVRHGPARKSTVPV
jgi:hypothetical protein